MTVLTAIGETKVNLQRKKREGKSANFLLFNEKERGCITSIHLESRQKKSPPCKGKKECGLSLSPRKKVSPRNAEKKSI